MKCPFLNRPFLLTALALCAAGLTAASGSGLGSVPEGTRVIRSIDYTGGGGKRQTLDLYLPPKAAAGTKLPLIVYIHGGGWMVGDKNQAKWRMQGFMESGEYAVASVNYRLSGDAVWPAQIHDCKAALRWLKAHAPEHGFDRDRFILVGVSAGGHLAAMLATTEGRAAMAGVVGNHPDQSDDVTAAVIICGPTTFGGPVVTPPPGEKEMGGYLTTRLLGAAVSDQPELARAASPLTYASASAAPMLLIYGTEDPLVPVTHGQVFDQALQDAGASSILVRVEGAGHIDLITPEASVIINQFTAEMAAGRSSQLKDTVLQKKGK